MKKIINTILFSLILSFTIPLFANYSFMDLPGRAKDGDHGKNNYHPNGDGQDGEDGTHGIGGQDGGHGGHGGSSFFGCGGRGGNGGDAE
ncbi:MAG TPA: hypothetical protein PLC42_03405 [Parachlamydiaceae bacterium]|nr:hypothetical protein [Parachlamydiaceae bacterium]